MQTSHCQIDIIAREAKSASTVEKHKFTNSRTIRLESRVAMMTQHGSIETRGLMLLQFVCRKAQRAVSARHFADGTHGCSVRGDIAQGHVEPALACYLVGQIRYEAQSARMYYK
jgi:hypothetical protein